MNERDTKPSPQVMYTDLSPVVSLSISFSFYRVLEAATFFFLISLKSSSVHKTNLKFLHLKILSSSMETVKWECGKHLCQ